MMLNLATLPEETVRNPPARLEEPGMTHTVIHAHDSSCTEAGRQSTREVDSSRPLPNKVPIHPMKFIAMVVRSLKTEHAGRAARHRARRGRRHARRRRGLKTELRRQVAGAALGQRLAKSWRDRHYPNQKLDAASLVYSKAPQIIRASDEGARTLSRDPD